MDALSIFNQLLLSGSIVARLINMSSSAGLLLVLLAATGFSNAQSPSPISTVYVTPVPSPTPPTCPGSDGRTYRGPSGSDFIIECGVDHAGGDMSNTRVNTFEECIQACDKEPACVDVSLSGVACTSICTKFCPRTDHKITRLLEERDR